MKRDAAFVVGAMVVSLMVVLIAVTMSRIDDLEDQHAALAEQHAELAAEHEQTVVTMRDMFRKVQDVRDQDVAQRMDEYDALRSHLVDSVLDEFRKLIDERFPADS